MIWNWQHKAWPIFTYDADQLTRLEDCFLLEGGRWLGAFSHCIERDRIELTIGLMSHEAQKSSEIEGEMLSRDSLQSSLRRQFGLATDRSRIPPAEQGIAEMMMDLYHNFDAPLHHDTLFQWHAKLMMARRDLHDIGRYRTSGDPMQVVSGYVHRLNVHFEAPPSVQVSHEMNGFVEWFNRTAPDGAHPLPALARAGLAHLFFVTIHPFEDGNGRIARALSEKVLAQSLGQPVLIALSQHIEKNRKDYYAHLNRHNRTLHVTAWLSHFASTILKSVDYSRTLVDFFIGKARLYDRVRGQLNPRQEKALARMFKEGVDGFKGGLSADKYIKITQASRATATRDLQKLLEIGALTRTGRLKGTRYWLHL